MRPLVKNLTTLRDGGTIEFEGVRLKMVEGKETGWDLDIGDTYYACRNTENLLTVREVQSEIGCIHPVEVAYSFDMGECVGVEICE